MRNATSLRGYGISMIAMDYPFTGNGPRDRRYHTSSEFLKMIKEAVDYYKQFNVPVYLLGHSFGCYVIQEMLAQYGDIVSGAFMLSPGGNQTPDLLQHYLDFRFSPDWQAFIESHGIEMDNKAERWAEGKDGKQGVGGQFTSGRSTGAIQTKVPVVVIRGENDPWSTEGLAREIAGRFENGTFIPLAGATHQSVLTVRNGKEAFITLILVQTIEAATGIKLPKSKQKVSAKEKVLSYAQHSDLFRENLKRRGIADVNALTETEAAQVLERWEKEDIQLISDYAKKRMATLNSFRFFEALDYLVLNPAPSDEEFYKRFGN